MTIIQGDGFFISYQAHEPGSKEAEFSELMGNITALIGHPHRPPSPETAIVIEDDPCNRFSGCRYLILLGDFREEYQKRIHSLDECLSFFKQNIEKMSDWSDQLPKEELNG